MLAARSTNVVSGAASSEPAAMRAGAAGGTVDRRPIASQTLVLALALLSAVLLVLGLVQEALVLDGPPVGPRWIIALFAVVAWTYLAAGVIAWRRRPGNRIGPIMVAGAVVWLVAGFANVEVPVLVAAGLIVATVPLAIVVHLLHAFPSGRLRGRLSRATVAAGYVVCLVLQAPLYLFAAGPDSARAPLRIADRPGIVEAADIVQLVAGAAVMALTVALLGRRLWRAPRDRRRVIAPLYAYGIAAVVVVPLIPRLPAAFPEGEASAALQLGLLAGIPVAFVVGLLLGGFARTTDLPGLVARLGADGARPALGDVLADALGDPSVELTLIGPTPDDAVDAPPAPGRGAVDVVVDGRRVGVIGYDATLIADRSTVEAAGRVAALALRNEQMAAELRVGRDRLEHALARTVEAADAERRRIARDLHDGLQGRLVVLAIQADAAGEAATPAEARARADELGAGLQLAITELRDLVQGVMPAMLTERGLCAAAEELADRCPIPVSVEVPEASGPLPGPVETAGCFIVAEALANAVKHSGASAVHLRITRPGTRLLIELADDGLGGAQANGGAGLRGMADRVDALGGRLLVRSPPGDGTEIRAELPCAS